jgi:hypothetical protein
MRWLLVGVIAAAACSEGPLVAPVVDMTALPDLGHPHRSKVDVLFMIDNSAGMEPKTWQLQSAFSSLLAVFDGLAQQGTPLDLHIGVVTSDYGAGTGNAPGCGASPGGQAGRLQAVGAFASASCMPPSGANFIRYDYGTMANNLPAGLDFAQTFTCMASVDGVTGSGCGFEHQLESVRAALGDNLPGNAGFLRDDALLAVFFLTDEDDCSAPPVTDLFDKALVAQYGYEDSYRCTRFGILCDGKQPPYGVPSAQLRNCVPAPNPGSYVDNPGSGPGKLFDVQLYLDFFGAPASAGGRKEYPGDVLLAAIDAPSTPVDVILSDPANPGGAMCSQLDEQSNPACVQVLQHACQDPQQPFFYGDPAVRLNAVIDATGGVRVGSICDTDYRAALTAFGQAIAARL